MAGMLARFAALAGGVTDPQAIKPGGKFYLPVVLEETGIATAGAHTDYTSVGAGDFSQRGSGPKLSTLTLNTLTLDYVPDWYATPEVALTHDEMKEALEAINDARTPFDLLLTIPSKQQVFAHMHATLRTLTQTMKGREADTWYWTIAVEKWRNAKSGRATAAKSSRKRGVTFPTTHKLTATDTYHSLSLAYYGSYEGWAAIAEANGFRSWGASTPLVKSKRYKVGSVVKIPQWLPTIAKELAQPTTAGTVAIL